MENVSAERSAGWSVLCYVAVVVLASMLTNGMPTLGARPLSVALAIDANRVGLLCGAWLEFPAAAFFLWFLVGLRSYLTNAPGRREGLPTFALASGVVMTAMSLMAAALLTAALYALGEIQIVIAVLGFFGSPAL